VVEEVEQVIPLMALTLLVIMEAMAVQVEEVVVLLLMAVLLVQEGMELFIYTTKEKKCQ
jgi:hypothetical protein